MWKTCQGPGAAACCTGAAERRPADRETRTGGRQRCPPPVDSLPDRSALHAAGVTARSRGAAHRRADPRYGPAASTTRSAANRRPRQLFEACDDLDEVRADLAEAPQARRFVTGSLVTGEVEETNRAGAWWNGIRAGASAPALH